MNVPGEVAADFALPRAVVVSGRAVERGTGRPMLATQSQGCHGPGPVKAGHVWYRPLAGNAALTGNEAGDYYRYLMTIDPRGLYVGLVESGGAFRGVVPPGPGVLLLEASPGMPFMWTSSKLPWRESDGYHRRFPYAPVTRREPADGAPRTPGAAVDTPHGAFGPIALENVVAYRVIEPAANDAPYKVEITIPTAPTRRVRFVDPDGRPVRGALVFGVTSSPLHQVKLDGDEVEIIALDPTRERRLTARSPDGRLSVETTVRADSAEPIIVRMQQWPGVTGRLVNEAGKAVAPIERPNGGLLGPHPGGAMRLPRMTMRHWMAGVLFVAAMLAVRDQLARMRRQQIEAKIEGIARALAEYRHKYGSGWQCRVTLPEEPSAPGP
jgi:hypothetical protein